MLSYNQALKKKSREMLIIHAVKSLTAGHQSSRLVSRGHLDEITTHFNISLHQALGFQDVKFCRQFDMGLKKKKVSWSAFYKGIAKAKKPGELKVLYLSGPEPLNDVEIFCSQGVRLENIWAIESDKKIYQEAIKSLTEKGVQIKIHRGSLAEFFEITNHEFDIIYYDACSPIIAPKQSPLEILKQLFQHKRLTPLSALITNFAEPDNNYNWGDILASWFATKEHHGLPANDMGWEGPLIEKAARFNKYSRHINQHVHAYYDIFLTHFISSMASEIIPMWQLCALSSVQSNHLLEGQLLARMMEKIRAHEPSGTTVGELLTTIPHYLLSMEAYPLLNWARNIRDNLPPEHVLHKFISSCIKQMSIEDAMYVGSLLKRFEEAGSGFKTFIYDVCGDNLKKTLANVDFFDRDLGIACDIPMKNLLVELLIGLYGYPYIAHAGKAMSVKYKAKETWMFANVFIFDQCRYLYDFLPTIDLWESFFSDLPNQAIIRACIDGIRRNHFELNDALFLWGFMKDMGGEFGYAELPQRINLNELPDNHI